MTHEELLEKIDIRNKYIHNMEGCGPAKSALYEVVKLHEPIISPMFPKSSGICLTCTPPSLNFYEAIRYPCPTIQIIEKELS